VQATKQGRSGKVKALQRLLTHSFSAKALAVKRVTENQGKRTPGVDKSVWDTPLKKATAIRMLRQRGYRSHPLRRIYIPKPHSAKKRPLDIPCMIDRAMQALYLLALEPIAETTADPNSYGFRPGRATVDAIEQCHTVLSRAASAPWILEGDIRACFNEISHPWLEQHIPMDKAILRNWLKAGFIEQHVLYPTEAGAPQGGICSPTLANLTLDGLEQLLHHHYPKTTRQGKAAKVNLVRYCDDFIVTGSSKELLEQEVKGLVEQFLHQRGLTLSAEKTSITHVENGFDFLGFRIRKYKRKLLTTPSKKSVKTLLMKARAIVKGNRQASAGRLIQLLNPVIRGWAHYYQHSASKHTFAAVDYAIFQALWRWAKRRHPNKGRRWVKERYYRTIGSRHWVFHGEIDGKDLILFRASRVPISRHIKVKGAANPFDATWEPYFERRLSVKMERTLQGRRKLLYLWKEQQGICPVCKQNITELSTWHVHHIVWRTRGGADTAENRVLVHPNCHRQIHSQGLEVRKPRPSVGV
jgi:RNA-directed DNA polymerase